MTLPLCDAISSEQWGHDFRPDYVNLSILKHNFPHVPLIALTGALPLPFSLLKPAALRTSLSCLYTPLPPLSATATERVRLDVTSVLGISGCPVFLQSFNRPNLVRPLHFSPPSLPHSRPSPLAVSRLLIVATSPIPSSSPPTLRLSIHPTPCF